MKYIICRCSLTAVYLGLMSRWNTNSCRKLQIASCNLAALDVKWLFNTFEICKAFSTRSSSLGKKVHYQSNILLYIKYIFVQFSSYPKSYRLAEEKICFIQWASVYYITLGICENCRIRICRKLIATDGKARFASLWNLNIFEEWIRNPMIFMQRA